MCVKEQVFRFGKRGQTHDEDADPPLRIVCGRRARIRGRDRALREGTSQARLELYHAESIQW